MKSIAEGKQRESENLVHPFEVLHGPCPQRYISQERHDRRKKKDRKIADPRRMVKEYCRPTVGQRETKPSDLRPPHILSSTVDYLIDQISSQNVPWPERYDFLFNRLRSVRQDLVMQDYQGAETVDILEKCVCFHVYSDYRLCTEQPAVFDQKINNQHIQECLKRLLNLYQASEMSCVNQVEFETIYILFNLGDADALKHFYSLQKEHRHCHDLRLAYQISISYIHNNWVRTLRLIQQLNKPLYLCAVHRHFPGIWRKALNSMSSGYSSKVLKYPIDKLTYILGLNTDTETQELCDNLGVEIHGSSVRFLKGTFKSSELIARRHSDFISGRIREYSISDILHGRVARHRPTQDISHSRNVGDGSTKELMHSQTYTDVLTSSFSQLQT